MCTLLCVCIAGSYSLYPAACRNGYKMCIRAYLNGNGIGKRTHLSVFFVLMKGEFDPLLKWPFDCKVVNTHKHLYQKKRVQYRVISWLKKFVTFKLCMYERVEVCTCSSINLAVCSIKSCDKLQTMVRMGLKFPLCKAC